MFFYRGLCDVLYFNLFMDENLLFMCLILCGCNSLLGINVFFVGCKK